jgi:hypothetical protein
MPTSEKPIQDGQGVWYRSRKAMYVTLIYRVMIALDMAAKDVQETDMYQYIKNAPWFVQSKVHGTFGRIKFYCKGWSKAEFKNYLKEALVAAPAPDQASTPKPGKPASPAHKMVEKRVPELPTGREEKLVAFKKLGTAIMEEFDLTQLAIMTLADGRRMMHWIVQDPAKSKKRR